MTPERPPSADDIPPVSAEALVEGEESADGRRYPSTIGGLLYLAVLVTTVLGLVLVVTWDWRRGVILMGSAMLAAALVRLVLRERDAGMLAVRNRWLDAFWLVAAGTVLIALAVSIPDQPGM